MQRDIALAPFDCSYVSSLIVGISSLFLDLGEFSLFSLFFLFFSCAVA